MKEGSLYKLRMSFNEDPDYYNDTWRKYVTKNFCIGYNNHYEEPLNCEVLFDENNEYVFVLFLGETFLYQQYYKFLFKGQIFHILKFILNNPDEIISIECKEVNQ